MNFFRNSLIVFVVQTYVSALGKRIYSRYVNMVTEYRSPTANVNELKLFARLFNFRNCIVLQMCKHNILQLNIFPIDNLGTFNLNYHGSQITIFGLHYGLQLYLC